jgi:hypothetical protein
MLWYSGMLSYKITDSDLKCLRTFDMNGKCAWISKDTVFSSYCNIVGMHKF